MTLRQMLNGRVNVPHGRDAKVGDVHADLRASVGDDADGLHSMQAAVRGANVAGDGAGGGDVHLMKMNVVGNQEISRSHRRSSGGLMKSGPADVGAARRIAARGFAQTFELASAHIFELNAVGPRRSGSVEVDRNAIASARSADRPAAPARRTPPARCR